MLLLFSGGGVGGLTLAFALSRSPNIHVDVYEAASKFAEIGAGIGLWWRTRQILTSLGLEEDIIRLLPSHPGEDKGKPGRCSRCMTLPEVLAVPSVQLRKADQPNGHALGTAYSRSMVFLNWLTQMCTSCMDFPFFSVQVE